MEILGTTQACFGVDDDLLDFTLEGGNDEEEAVDPKASACASASASASASSSSSRPKSLPFFFGTQDVLFPEFAEEELEWLSNKDAFPAIETCFGILSDNPQLVSTHQSPISVLENSSITSSHSNSDNNSISAASCCNNSLAVPAAGHPVRARSKRRRRTLGFRDLLPVPFRATKLPRSAADGSRAGRKCAHCQTEKTPQWRAGPMGPKTLCNACGVRYKSGRLLPEYRPASSPTFSNKLHSNSHRKVVEMRRKKQMAAAEEEEEGIMVNVPVVVSCGYNVG